MPTKTTQFAPIQITKSVASKAGPCSACGKGVTKVKGGGNVFPKTLDSVIYALEGLGGKCCLCRDCIKYLKAAEREKGGH